MYRGYREIQTLEYSLLVEFFALYLQDAAAAPVVEGQLLLLVSYMDLTPIRALVETSFNRMALSSSMAPGVVHILPCVVQDPIRDYENRCNK